MPGKRRRSKTRSRVTRAVQARFVKFNSNETCSKCGNIKQRHHICKHCGFYRGKNYEHYL